jgi:HSP20 family protein
MFYPRFFSTPTFRSWQPFDELSRMRSQMDRLMGAFESRPWSGSNAGVFPAINLTENENHYFVRAELPGVAANELEIQATGRNLTISGKRDVEVKPGEAKYHRREREAGQFSRVIGMPREINADKVEARMNNGILNLRIPKAESAKPKRITIGR